MPKDYSQKSDDEVRNLARTAGVPDADTADVESLRQKLRDRDAASGSSSSKSE